MLLLALRATTSLWFSKPNKTNASKIDTIMSSELCNAVSLWLTHNKSWCPLTVRHRALLGDFPLWLLSIIQLQYIRFNYSHCFSRNLQDFPDSYNNYYADDNRDSQYLPIIFVKAVAPIVHSRVHNFLCVAFFSVWKWITIVPNIDEFHYSVITF